MHCTWNLKTKSTSFFLLSISAFHSPTILKVCSVNPKCSKILARDLQVFMGQRSSSELDHRLSTYKALGLILIRAKKKFIFTIILRRYLSSVAILSIYPACRGCDMRRLCRLARRMVTWRNSALLSCLKAELIP